MKSFATRQKESNEKDKLREKCRKNGEYDYIGFFHKGRVAVEKNGERFHIDINGQRII